MSAFIRRLKLIFGLSQADSLAQAALRSDGEVLVDAANNIEMRLRGSTSTTGVILYPGGRCEAAAYAPFMRELVKADVLCVIARMPLKLAVLSPDRATAIMSAHQEIDRWIVGGHSLGGAMACRFAARNAERLNGLFLLGSYPPSSQDLGHVKFPVTLFYGTEDTLASPNTIKSSQDRLPDHAVFAEIRGGDHYQFGSFSNALSTATIDVAEQQLQVVEGVTDLWRDR